MVYILDRERQTVLCEALRGTGIEAEAFHTADAFFGACKDVQPLLVVVRLPVAQTAAFIQALKTERVTRPPVVVICVENTASARASVLDAGADDVVSVPFDMEELVSRIRAALRRDETRRATSIEHEGVVLDDERRRVTVDGRPQSLTYTEYEILKLMLRDAGKVQSRATILERVWGPSDIGETRAVDMHIAALRRKLGSRGKLIQTIRGSGYLLACEKTQD